MGVISRIPGLQKKYYIGPTLVMVFESHYTAVEYYQRKIRQGLSKISVVDNEVYLG